MTLDDAECAVHPDASPGRYVTITVSDTGVGMDEATLKLIFQPFFTTKPPGKGTALGLATVQGIVKQSGGFLSVTSVPYKGTTVTIYLPTINEAGNHANLLDHQCPVAAPETILLVEDDSVA
jgi:two-component system, cell cycle sensor histidine kinase and response regulator CckA